MTCRQVYEVNSVFCVVGRLESLVLPQMGADSVLVKMLAAPINPSDLNMIQGKSQACNALSK